MHIFSPFFWPARFIFQSYYEIENYWKFVTDQIIYTRNIIISSLTYEDLNIDSLSPKLLVNLSVSIENNYQS